MKEVTIIGMDDEVYRPPVRTTLRKELDIDGGIRLRKSQVPDLPHFTVTFYLNGNADSDGLEYRVSKETFDVLAQGGVLDRHG